MDRFRTARGIRGVALVLGASLLLAATAPVAQASRAGTALPLAEWLRTQLRVPPGEAFETALGTAVAARPHSLRAFLRAFLTAYEAAAPGVNPGADFTGHDCSHEALYRYLQQRYHRLVDDAVLPPPSLAPLPVPQSKTPDRFTGAVGQAGVRGLLPTPGRRTGLLAGAPGVPCAFRIQSPARPQGP